MVVLQTAAGIVVAAVWSFASFDPPGKSLGQE